MSKKEKNDGSTRKTVTRRAFLKYSAAAAAVATIGVAAAPLIQLDANTDKAPKSEETYSKVRSLKYTGKIANSDRMQAAANAKKLGVTTQAALVAGPPGQWFVPDYFGTTPNFANSQLATVVNGLATPGTGIQKFVAPIPNIPVATPDTLTYPGSDYYEISAVDYTQALHPNLAPTQLRGYVQTNNGTLNGVNSVAPAAVKYLGPIIVAQRNRPVRIKFTNKLGIGTAGNLTVPMDSTYMGAGMGPDGVHFYTQNRLAIHLHGGATPWISDGTPHQWITPAGETSTIYLKGDSVQNVPDMWFVNGVVVPNTVGILTPPVAGATNDPGAGSVTLFYSNEQSARLMFYHDHAYGITRLNVYSGLAAGYLLGDLYEEDLENGTNATGTNPTLCRIPSDLHELPLIIQDKTFIPNATQMTLEDPTWGFPIAPGNLWFPHVYMPNQNPYTLSGANNIGRWDYGPWFWPPFTGLANGPIANPYYNPVTAPWEPPFMPGIPNPTGVPEGFMDTPVVNGMAYPVLTVEPKPYRFKFLNACNDRYLNLQLYRANPGIVCAIMGGLGGTGYTSATTVTISGGGGVGATAVPVIAPITGAITAIDLLTVGSGYTSLPTVTIADPGNPVLLIPGGSGAAAASAVIYNAPTEVGMVPATDPGAWPAGWPTRDGRAGGFPDPSYVGPTMIQIGNEGGLLPGPAPIQNRPVGYDYNRRVVTVLNVLEKALYMGPAERADVVVDFTGLAGKTFILYNDAPAPMPAFDPRFDYFTGDGDQTSVGGAPNTPPGYGPNTRTIMQIVVGPTVTVPSVFSGLAALQTALPAVFAASQEQIIVPQAPYNAAYAGTFPGDATAYVAIQDTSHTFTPIGSTTPITMDLQPKAIIEDFDFSYGRMNALLGVEVPHTNITNQTSIIQHYIDPPTELVATTLPGLLVGAAGDGTQLWKITHNGVDTHAIHVHLYTAQLVNRVGWDGMIKPPDANELGWKDTFQMNPLEDIVLALRPIKLSTVPFAKAIPNSVRLLDPTMPAGTTTQFTGVDPLGTPVTVTNQKINFGQEYVWHCHLLGHEENDMMRAQAIAVPPEAPTNLAGVLKGSSITLTWVDNSASETAYVVQRATGTGPYVTIATLPAKAGIGTTVTYVDKTVKVKNTYKYQVFAANTVGLALAGYPVMTATSAASNVFTITM